MSNAMDARSYTNSVKAALRAAGLPARVTSSVTHAHRMTVINDCAALDEVVAVLSRTFPAADVDHDEAASFVSISWPEHGDDRPAGSARSRSPK